MVIKKGKGALHERQTDRDGMECRKTKQKRVVTKEEVSNMKTLNF
jgi:hypothetical protein